MCSRVDAYLMGKGLDIAGWSDENITFHKTIRILVTHLIYYFAAWALCLTRRTVRAYLVCK